MARTLTTEIKGLTAKITDNETTEVVFSGNEYKLGGYPITDIYCRLVFGCGDIGLWGHESDADIRFNMAGGGPAGRLTQRKLRSDCMDMITWLMGQYPEHFLGARRKAIEKIIREDQLKLKKLRYEIANTEANIRFWEKELAEIGKSC